MKMLSSCYLLVSIVLLLMTTGGALCINLFRLTVPYEVNIKTESVELKCDYDMGADELYSVKWYKDELEFFRYTPSAGGSLGFPVDGVQLAYNDTDSSHCSVILTNISWNTAGAYRCELSTEAPTFRLYFDTVSMTIVDDTVIPPPTPNIQIFSTKYNYKIGDEISVNCTAYTATGDPSPLNIIWFINGNQLLEQQSGEYYTINESDSKPNKDGHIVKSAVFHIRATEDLFVGESKLLQIKCQLFNSKTHLTSIQAYVNISYLYKLHEHQPSGADYLLSKAHPLLILVVLFNKYYV